MPTIGVIHGVILISTRVAQLLNILLKRLQRLKDIQQLSQELRRPVISSRTVTHQRQLQYDANDQDGKRPGKITVNLLANGVKVDDKEVTAANDWNYSFTDLPKYAGGNEITYSVTENAVEDYQTLVNGYDITNSYTPGKTSVSVTKAWDDADNQDGKREFSKG